MLKKSMSLYVHDKIESEGSDEESDNEKEEAQNLGETNKIFGLESSPNAYEVFKKGRPLRKKKSLRRKSIGNIEVMEDIESLVKKSLSPSKRAEKLEHQNSANSVGKDDERSIFDCDPKKGGGAVANQYIAMTMKGYYSDSALDEINKVATQK